MYTNNLLNFSLLSFSYLVTDFGFRLTKQSRKNQPLDLLYQNETTAISISFDRWENQVFIMLYQLENAIFVKNPIFIDENTRLFGYDLDDVLSVRAPFCKVKKACLNHDGIIQTIDLCSKLIRQYASDILIGDFSLFPTLDQVVKNRHN